MQQLREDIEEEEVKSDEDGEDVRMVIAKKLKQESEEVCGISVSAYKQVSLPGECA